jgi:hypothetical protein
MAWFSGSTLGIRVADFNPTERQISRTLESMSVSAGLLTLAIPAFAIWEFVVVEQMILQVGICEKI